MCMLYYIVALNLQCNTFEPLSLGKVFFVHLKFWAKSEKRKKLFAGDIFNICSNKLLLSLILQNLNYIIIIVIIVIVGHCDGRKAICTQSPPRRSQVLHSASAA